jgi:hypothetical protein
MTELAALLADCDARGIRLHPAADGGLTIDAPQAAPTPDLLDRLKAHKAELLELLRPTPEAVGPTTEQSEPTTVCRCGSTTWRDVPIHNGQSVRRDCGRCGRFLAFPVWYGNTTGHKDQQSIQ